ncbi:MAG: hypothetical protein HY720_11470 [Planctomycetes bacterium]|nr:hypothetical protein [Planctomycetota bacterium]
MGLRAAGECGLSSIRCPGCERGARPWYYFRNRYYDPTHGRFVSRDPLGVWGDPSQMGNAYTLAVENAVNGVDPMGLEWQFDFETMQWKWVPLPGEGDTPNTPAPKPLYDLQYRSWLDATFSSEATTDGERHSLGLPKNAGGVVVDSKSSKTGTIEGGKTAYFQGGLSSVQFTPGSGTTCRRLVWVQIKTVQWFAWDDGENKVAVIPASKDLAPGGGAQLHKPTVDVLPAQGKDPTYGIAANAQSGQGTGSPKIWDYPNVRVPAANANVASSYTFYPVGGKEEDAKHYDNVMVVWTFEVNLVCLDTSPPTVIGHFYWRMKFEWSSSQGFLAGGQPWVSPGWYSGASPNYDPLIGPGKTFDHPH